MATIVENLSKLIDIKKALKQEINAKGGEVTDDMPFNQYSEEIKKIETAQEVDVVALIQRTITHITIPEGTWKIGRSVFSWCTNLEEIVIPSTITEIDDTDTNYKPFVGCTNVKRFEYYSTYPLTQNITSPFSSSIEVVKIGEGTPYLGAYLFLNSKFTEIEIPNSVEEIKLQAFRGCNQCLVFNFGNTRTTVPTLGLTSAFQDTNANKKIVVPDALYNQWITATNWSSTSYNIKTSIVKYSDYYGS